MSKVYIVADEVTLWKRRRYDAKGRVKRAKRALAQTENRLAVIEAKLAAIQGNRVQTACTLDAGRGAVIRGKGTG